MKRIIFSRNQNSRVIMLQDGEAVYLLHGGYRLADEIEEADSYEEYKDVAFIGQTISNWDGVIHCEIHANIDTDELAISFKTKEGKFELSFDWKDVQTFDSLLEGIGVKKLVCFNIEKAMVLRLKNLLEITFVDLN